MNDIDPHEILPMQYINSIFYTSVFYCMDFTCTNMIHARSSATGFAELHNKFNWGKMIKKFCMGNENQ